MPWTATDPRPEHTPFLAVYLGHVASMTELCERFGMRRAVSRLGPCLAFGAARRHAIAALLSWSRPFSTQRCLCQLV
jgi:hypothetical protein